LVTCPRLAADSFSGVPEKVFSPSPMSYIHMNAIAVPAQLALRLLLK
jgi:hypothetical protein